VPDWIIFLDFILGYRVGFQAWLVE